ncbi:MAG: C45 family autoproteolytic acyltransferase/hydrolase [Promethearchaeota archaeon]
MTSKKGFKSIDIIYTRGNHYEVGVQQGRLYRALVGQINMVKYLRGMELVQASKPIGGPPFNIVFNSILRRGGRNMIRSIASLLPNQFDKVEGLAEGLGTTVDKLASILYFVNFQGDMRLDTGLPKNTSKKNNNTNNSDNNNKNDTNKEVKTNLTGCSGAIVTKNDQGFLFKNFDFPNEIGEFQIARYVHLSGNNGYSTVTLGEGPIVGCISGMNEKGLAISWNSGYTQDINLKLAPVDMIAQEILETCKDTNEATEFLKNIPIPVGCIFLILDKNQEGTIIERTTNHIGIRNMESGKFGKYLAASNSFVSEETKKVQIPEETIWTIHGKHKATGKSVYGEPLMKDSNHRHERITELTKALTENEDPLSLKDLRNILADHKSARLGHNNGGEDTICRHGLFWKTLSSVYMEPKTKTIWVNEGNPCSNSDLLKLELKFDYEIMNIRYLRRYNPTFQFFDPLI